MHVDSLCTVGGRIVEGTKVRRRGMRREVEAAAQSGAAEACGGATTGLLAPGGTPDTAAGTWRAVVAGQRPHLARHQSLARLAARRDWASSAKSLPTFRILRGDDRPLP